MKWGEEKNHLDNMRKSRLEEHGIIKARKKKKEKNLNVREWATESTAVEGQEW